MNVVETQWKSLKRSQRQPLWHCILLKVHRSTPQWKIFQHAAMTIRGAVTKTLPPSDGVQLKLMLGIRCLYCTTADVEGEWFRFAISNGDYLEACFNVSSSMAPEVYEVVCLEFEVTFCCNGHTWARLECVVWPIENRWRGSPSRLGWQMIFLYVWKWRSNVKGTINALVPYVSMRNPKIRLKLQWCVMIRIFSVFSDL